MVGNNIITESLKVLVFHSNIDTLEKVELIRGTLLENDQIYQVDVDLEDADNLLRVECHPESSAQFILGKLQIAGLTGARLM
jgi:hypothetical protein